ncbi:E3 ubiquitin-protein ligase rnf146-like [Myripristis murdjan]|uniref:E3 ubiquitin-protein ligase n=1 Tax=Myripristis murdjan TaxID=586833 RepID=A0A668ARM2_9TELE|nr:E3 ubiquitin-protein ligase rnf146-like [Myripristis murdjan]
MCAASDSSAGRSARRSAGGPGRRRVLTAAQQCPGIHFAITLISNFKCGLVNIITCFPSEAACEGVLAVSMAGCGEVDQSVKALAAPKLVDDVGDPRTTDSPSSTTAQECAICLQSCIHPVLLPCRHVFCFLCVKGASWHSKRCALCRQEVPEDFLERPLLLSPEELKAAAAGVSRGGGLSTHGDYAWYYEGRNGWWQYDERTSRELEEAFSKGRKSTEMLIAGFLYVADLENMVQYRRNEHGRRRKIKRDVVDIPKKGVAGLRLDPEPAHLPASPAVTAAITERVSSADGADTTGQTQSAGFGIMVSAPPVRPPTVLGGHLVTPQSHTPLSLEESLSQLLISQPGGDEVEDDDEQASGSQAYEFASGSSEGEEEAHGWERGRAESMPRRRHRQRLLGRQLRETQPDRMPPRGGPSSSALSMRSRSPDGQCTVTEV